MESDIIRPVASSAPKAAARLVSLDTFRGFTMAFIVGGKSVLLALAALHAGGAVGFMIYELTHTPWVGLRFYDLIWPSFMLMVGVAIPFSFAKRSRTQTHGQIMASAARRAVVLFLLGSLRASLSNRSPTLIELSSALQPIALAYLVASFMAARSIRCQAAVAIGILAGYAALIAFVPGPDFPAGSYVKYHNLVACVDVAVLHEPQPDGWGTILSALPTVSTTLLGLIFGEVLLSGRSHRRKAAIIAATGLALVLCGYAFSVVIPIVMKMWTTSYGIATAGWAALIFAGFFWVIDVKGWKGWCFPFVVFGMNAIAIYLGVSIVSFGHIAGIFSQPVAAHLGRAGPLFDAAAMLALEWVVLLWMYRRKIFLKA
jgi:predicted acyltransferase